MTQHMLVAGASGVIGLAAVERFARLPGWDVTALSRRVPCASAGTDFRHVSADLRDAKACARLVKELPPVTHVVYAAVSEAPGLVSGWRDSDLIAENGEMLRNLLTPLAETGSLQHVSVMQGGKAYGAHVHPITVPLRESLPRDDHENFYWLHEDATRELAARRRFAFTIWRPQILLGKAPGAAMNPVAAIGAYAALCRELGLSFALPGESQALWEMVDADLLADALSWAAHSPQAAGETFNITNGDVFVLRHAWPSLAASLGLEAEGAAPETFAAFFESIPAQEAWQEIAARNNLQLSNLNDLLGQSHHYLDLLTGRRIAAKDAPMLVSTIKLRKAGFASCEDSLASLVQQLGQMVDLKLLPETARPIMQ